MTGLLRRIFWFPLQVVCGALDHDYAPTNATDCLMEVRCRCCGYVWRSR